MSPLLFNFALEYAIRKVQETNLGLDMNTHQVLAYADDVNVIGDDIRTIETNANVLLNEEITFKTCFVYFFKRD